MAEEPEEVDDAQRQQSNKDPICVDEEDPNEMDDDCPKIINMGGNSEMLLNRGVGNCVSYHVLSDYTRKASTYPTIFENLSVQLFEVCKKAST